MGADWYDYCWLGWLLIGIAVDSSELRFQFWFIQTYGILVLIQLNTDFSFRSSKLRFQFWFMWTYGISVLVHPNVDIIFWNRNLIKSLWKNIRHFSGHNCFYFMFVFGKCARPLQFILLVFTPWQVFMWNRLSFSNLFLEAQ